MTVRNRTAPDRDSHLRDSTLAAVLVLLAARQPWTPRTPELVPVLEELERRGQATRTAAGWCRPPASVGEETM